MKHLRKFDSVSEMNTFIANSTIGIVGLAYDSNIEPVLNVHVHTPVLPSNLTISCSNNTVTITATNATTIEYNTDGSSTYITYTEPFTISQTVTVYAKATNADGSITASQECQYVNPIDYTVPFYIEDVSGSSNTVQITKTKDGAPTLTIEKSTDGTTWTSMGDTSTTALEATIPANGKLYLRCNTNSWRHTTYEYFNTIKAIGNHNIGGNILSLQYGNTFNGQQVFRSAGSGMYFCHIFADNVNLISAKNLILASNTQFYCYREMFTGCTALTTAPELPATTLAQYCYTSMFSGCTALTQAPELSATTLNKGCYLGMFSLCTSLTQAPELPATTLANNCYQNMFYGCTNLNHIKCLATDISASNCTNNWVNGVAASGTFIKDENMTNWTTGNNGIPTGWVVTSTGITLSQSLNVATIEATNLDSGTGYYTINGGSQVSLSEGTTNVPITQAMNGQTLLVYGEFNGEPTQETITLNWVDYSPTITISETDNYVTITAPNANTIQYRLGSTGEYTNYTVPVYINEDTTIYVTATRTVSGVDYTSTASQEVEHVLIPPTNLVISCTNNFVTITATNATTIEYNTDGSSTYTTYTAPFEITETVTVYAKATNADDSITASQECQYVNLIDYTVPFYIEDVSGSSNTVTIKKSSASAPTLAIQKSTDGATWETMGSTTRNGITATIPANGKLYLRCNTSAWCNSSNSYYNYINTNGNCNIGGNTMSLLYGSDFTGNETTFKSGYTYQSYGLFRGVSHIIDASKLLLPATTLASNCYAYMFYDCTSLTTTPELPATTLANNCYQQMFQGCTRLTTAPALPATTLANYCYYGMFYNCSNLNYIECLATNISASSCTTVWVGNVAASGTFVKNPSMSSWTTGTSGIPEGWTVEDATE